MTDTIESQTTAAASNLVVSGRLPQRLSKREAKRAENPNLREHPLRKKTARMVAERASKKAAQRLHDYALALRWQRQLDDGVYASQADIAREFGISRARVTQILDLALMAPVEVGNMPIRD